MSFNNTERFTAFTVWAWVVQAVYFAAVVLLHLERFSYERRKQADGHGDKKTQVAASSTYRTVLCRVSWVAFEVAFAMALLVSVVVTYVLIPGMKMKGIPRDVFFQFFPLLFHNANIVFMGVEILLNKIPFSLWHFPFIVILGLLYVVFSWYWVEVSGVFYYFFLDYSHPLAVAFHLGLVLAVAAFFFFGMGLVSLRNSRNPFAYLLIFLITASVIKLTDR
jgi:hypothetical protein